jgi:hypothetical protein
VKALGNGVSEFDIENIRCSTFLAIEEIQKCSTFDARIQPFLNFKKQNEAIFIYCDKSPSLAYISETDYKTKLWDLFGNKNFSKIDNFKIETELVAFRLLLRETIKDNIFNTVGETNGQQ